MRVYILGLPQVGHVKHYPVIERVRYCTGLFPFNFDLIFFIVVIIYMFFQNLNYTPKVR